MVKEKKKITHVTHVRHLAGKILECVIRWQVTAVKLDIVNVPRCKGQGVLCVVVEFK